MEPRVETFLRDADVRLGATAGLGTPPRSGRMRILEISRANVPNHSPFTPEWKLAIHAGLLGGCLHAGRWLKQRASQRLVEALSDTFIVQLAHISKKNSKPFCFGV